MSKGGSFRELSDQWKIRAGTCQVIVEKGNSARWAGGGGSEMGSSSRVIVEYE